MFLWSADFLPKLTFSKNSSRNTIRVSYSLDPDPDQARQFVGPDLGLNCLQKFVNIFLLNSFNMGFGAQKNRLNEYPTHMFG